MVVHNQSEEEIKYLPLGRHEVAGTDIVIQLKMRLRQFSGKSIFMGGFSRPLPRINFDSRIMLERVNKTQQTQKLIVHTNFSDNFYNCDAIKAENFKHLINNKLAFKPNYIKEVISNTYSLEVSIPDRLEMIVIIFIGDGDN